MTERRSPPRRDDRPSEPHVRIPDSFYDAMRFITPYETTLWLALKTREWRKDGKGYVRKPSLRRIARDIGMPNGTAQRAFQGLRLKGMAEQLPNGAIRVLTPDFTTLLTTPFTTEVTKKGQRTDGENDPGGVSDCTRGGQYWPRGGHDHLLYPTKQMELTLGRSVKDPVRAPRKNRRARTVDTTSQKKGKRLGQSARLSPSAVDAAEPSKTKAKESEDTMSKPDEISVQGMDRKTALELLGKIRREAFEHADEAERQVAAKRRKHREAAHEAEEERREVLRRQAAELQAEDES